MVSDGIAPALVELGWSPYFHRQLLLLDASVTSRYAGPERISAQHRGAYSVTDGSRTRAASLSGRLRHELSSAELPCVGDWVLVNDGGQIEHVFERSTAFVRNAAGRTSEAQCVAANVDLAVIVAALSSPDADPHRARRELSIRRLERYLQAAALARVQALIVLNKADLNASAAELTHATQSALSGAEVLALSAADGAGVAELSTRIGHGTTAVLIGSSGVGKSTLTNRLLGRAEQETREVRDDDGRGRHMTTGRELFLLPDGGVLIDTPGMRELALVAGDDAAASAFDDIAELAESCRFSDCRHDGEPGCAVRAAVSAGTLRAERLAHARKLERELDVQRSRTDARARAEQKKRHKALSRQIRTVLAAKGRRA